MIANFDFRFHTVIDWILRALSVIVSLFYDARLVLHAVLFLIIIDQVMGVTYALKLKQFSWKTFNKVYRKVITYMAVILAAFVYERYLLNSEAIYFTKIIGALVGFQELSSAYLTFAKMTGINIFEQIIKKIK
ncbi:phage holin family protein [uncultured Draconibacterium sp.]|uniref:phage holin family protein n=1 Tax=uncultured Draconibacterium sp. TaxID=1573823 RepID=UPI00326039A0